MTQLFKDIGILENILSITRFEAIFRVVVPGSNLADFTEFVNIVYQIAPIWKKDASCPHRDKFLREFVRDYLKEKVERLNLVPKAGTIDVACPETHIVNSSDDFSVILRLMEQNHDLLKEVSPPFSFRKFVDVFV
jgi:hypothetical protein